MLNREIVDAVLRGTLTEEMLAGLNDADKAQLRIFAQSAAGWMSEQNDMLADMMQMLDELMPPAVETVTLSKATVNAFLHDELPDSVIDAMSDDELDELRWHATQRYNVLLSAQQAGDPVEELVVAAYIRMQRVGGELDVELPEFDGSDWP